MNIDDMTIGQLNSLINPPATTLCENSKTNIAGDLIGKCVLVRSRNEGINSGVLVAADDTGVVLADARRIWYHRPADKSMCWYEGVAISGLSSDSKVSAPVKQKVIIEDYSITECSGIAEKSLKEFTCHEQS